jgi:predicted ATPase
MSAFGLAVEYSQKGLVLLGDSKWQTEYPLSLALATSLAEMSLADHNYIGCKIAIDEVVLNAESIDDKQPVYYILIESLCDQGRADECIELGLQLLQTMGEKVRNNGFRLGVTPSNVRTQFNKNSQ